MTVMEKFHIISLKAVAQLRKEASNQFVMLMKHENMSIEYFTPQKIDNQEPHIQDEIYVIASGSGTFYGGGDQVKFDKGDVIFVPKGMKHHFEKFTDDFATWVIFYGEENGG